MAAAETDTWDGKIVQYGKMREAIGGQQHQGRVELKKLVEQPHFYGVAALAKLDGEATIIDGKITVTRVDDEHRLKAIEPLSGTEQATLLVGAFVPAWKDVEVTADVPANELEQFIADAASKADVDTSKPFVFALEGKLSDLRLHVIHGACPMHARLTKTTLPKEQQPVEVELDQVEGTVIGVFAKDAVGNITHPATSTHMHVVFKDDKSRKMVTGHVEKIGVRKGAILKLPKIQ